MTELSAGIMLALLVVEILMVLATLIAFEIKSTLPMIIALQAFMGVLGYLFFPVIVSAFGG